jgi:hypothetical protein
MRNPLIFSLILLSLSGTAQIPDAIYSDRIKSVQLHVYGNQLLYPIIRLNSNDRLELHFDDLDANVKSYYYAYQLCNADWTPAILSQFDFIRGFSSQRLTTYRLSSIAFTRYTHYTAVLPDANCIPTRSGNYILKVFRDADTSKLLFTKRMLVVEDRASIPAEIQQPYNGQIFRSHQKIQFKVNLNETVNVANHLQQIKVVILQNNRWDNAVFDLRPTFFSRNSLEYNTENDAVFPAGKEWRWLDLRSLRLQSDRVANAKYNKTSTDIFLKPDLSRSSQQFSFFGDYDGIYTIQTSESVNPYWQGDYATVNFTYVPAGNAPMGDKDIYVFGALTNYSFDENARLKFNEEKGVFETNLLLKQGYYDYCYVTIDRNSSKRKASFEYTEGNYWETENMYTILVYYRPLGGRADELIGITKVNSLTGRR